MSEQMRTVEVPQDAADTLYRRMAELIITELYRPSENADIIIQARVERTGPFTAYALLDDQGELHGTITLAYNDTDQTAQITELIVPEIERGLGRGKALLNGTALQMQQRNVQHVIVAPDNPARGFYIRVGFNKVKGKKYLAATPEEILARTSTS